MIGEEITRSVFEYTFDKPFAKTRPKWLKGLKKFPLELDGYNKELNIAFEYQGAQHYKFVPFYYKSQEQFEYRMKVDVHKRKLCKDKGVILIEIPYTVKLHNIQKFIVKELFKLGIKKDKPFLSIDDIVIPNCDVKMFSIIQDIVEEKEGIILADKYVRSDHVFDVICKEGHQFQTCYNYLRDGNWCKDCVTLSQRIGVEKMIEFAKSKNGKCLSKVYTTNKHKLEWECEKGHRFSMRANDVLTGHWCNVCGGSKQHTIEMMRELAKKNNGKCLSEVYTNNRTLLEWECEKGHKFKSYSSNIINGSWCNYCSKYGKNTIETIHYFAEENGAECLSKEYIPRKKIKWRCKNGHVFEKKIEECKVTFCVQCNKDKKKPERLKVFNELRNYARSKGGDCISQEYINCRTPLVWICKNSHIFEGKCDQVKKRKKFCTICQE